jgi:hypothetical protein
MRIAFCTSCMGRKWQLEMTLGHNLEILRKTGHFLALCNYNSSDGLDELVKAKFQADIREGTLVYFHTREPTSFHMSVAKNTSHRLALTRSPDILFNLDADNYITASTLESVGRAFSHNRRSVLHNWTWDWYDGTSGRIALTAGDWVHLGGYEEALLPMSVQDIDLLFRARAAGLSYVLDREVGRPAVSNDLVQKLENVSDENQSNPNILARYLLMNSANFSRAMACPMTLSLSTQTRFRGVLGEGAEVEV